MPRDLIESGPSWIQAVANWATAEGDDSETQVRKRVMVMATVIAMVIVTPWGLFYIGLGLPITGAIPLTYVVISAGILSYAARTKRVNGLLVSQLGMFLVLPMLVHVSLGGFANSSGVAMYSAVLPVGVLSFANAKHSGLWFGAFAAVVLALVPFESALAKRAPELPEAVIGAFFAVNIVTTALITFLSLDVYVRSRNRLAADLAFERERSDRLLLNVLPPPIAQRLKDGETVIADRHDRVAVLFADIVGFTPLSEALDPEELMADLNALFSEMDELAQDAGVEKVKTIGDAFMAMSGADGRATDTRALVDLAIKIQEYSATASIGPRESIEMRCGIDVGPVVAGVIGNSRFIYDVYGDTVNMASRMESHGLPGEIHVTERVRNELDGVHEFTECGPIDIKGIGPTRTYLVKRDASPSRIVSSVVAQRSRTTGRTAAS